MRVLFKGNINDAPLFDSDCWNNPSKKRLIRKPTDYTSNKEDMDTTIRYSCKTAKSNERTWKITTLGVRENKSDEDEFIELSTKWKKETAHYSTMFHKLINPNYLKIIGMGERVVKFILKDLQRSPELWHEALYYITKENPVSPQDMNDIFKIQKAWVEWGKKRNKI